MTRLIDLTRPLTAQTLAYPGEETAFRITRQDVGIHNCVVSELTRFDLHVGTHIDAPLHFVPGGTDVAGLGTPLLPMLLVTATGGEIGPDVIAGDVCGRAVLFNTAWTRTPDRADYYQGYPVLTLEAAEWLVEHGAALVGLDTPSADHVCIEGGFPIHKTLLGAGIPIVEGLTGLDRLHGCEESLWFGAFPLPIADIEGSPVRAVALDPTGFD